MRNPYRHQVPNQIPPNERLMHIGLSVLLLAYGTYGLWVNGLYVPGRRRGVHFHDTPAWLLYGAIVCAVMMSVVLDHYDRRETAPRPSRSVPGSRPDRSRRGGRDSEGREHDRVRGGWTAHRGAVARRSTAQDGAPTSHADIKKPPARGRRL